MKLFDNVLSDELLQEIRGEIHKAVPEHKWTSSFAWPHDLTFGIVGTSLQCLIEDEVKEKILDQIQHLLPKCEKYHMQYYLWLPNSGIAVHNDYGKVFGATIYLNEQWHSDQGGIFIYKKSATVNDPEWTALLPKHNTMILNDIQEHHMVTPVSPYSPDVRTTIQIWGL